MRRGARSGLVWVCESATLPPSHALCASCVCRTFPALSRTLNPSRTLRSKLHCTAELFYDAQYTCARTDGGRGEVGIRVTLIMHQRTRVVRLFNFQG